MLLLKNYVSDTINFVNSLTIKINDVNKHFNYNFYLKKKIPIPSDSSSKYYLNLTGNYSSIDNKVYILDPLTSERVELTKDLLDKNSHIRFELSKFGTTFNKLCYDNPGMVDYIRGCINPIDMHDLLDAPDLTILTYMDNYIGENEDDIIVKLNIFIKKYMFIYHNKAFMLDELYLPALLSSFYNALVIYVLVLKLKNIFTSRVDEFHLTAYLASYKGINEYVDIFDKSTKIWLYGNIDRIKHELGKNKILDQVLNKVLDSNGYSTAKLSFNQTYPTVLEDKVNKYDEEFIENTGTFIANKASDSTYGILGDEYTTDKINSLGYSNEILLANEGPDEVLVDKVFNGTNSNVPLTKTFLLDKVRHANIREHNRFTLIVSNLLYLLNNNEIDYVMSYFSNIDRSIHNLYPKELEELLILLLCKINGIDTSIVNIELIGVYSNKHSKATVLSKTVYKDSLSDIYDYITSNVELTLVVNSNESMTSKLNANLDIETKVWYLISNTIDPILRNDLKIILNMLLSKHKLTYDLDAIKTNTKDVDIKNIPNEYLEDLLVNVTGIEIDASNIVKEYYTKVRNFFNSVTSYTIQLLADLNFTNEDTVNVVKNGVNLGYKGLVEIKKASWHRFEQAEYLIKAISYPDTRLEQYDVRDKFKFDILAKSNMPLFILRNDITHNPRLLANVKTRLNLYGTDVVASVNYDDTSLTYDKHNYNEVNVRSNVPFFISEWNRDTIGNALMPLYSRGSKKATMINYSTRYNGASHIYDNNSLLVNKSDMIEYYIKGVRDGSVYIDNNDIDNATVVNVGKEHGLPKLKTGSIKNTVAYDKKGETLSTLNTYNNITANNKTIPFFITDIGYDSILDATDSLLARGTKTSIMHNYFTVLGGVDNVYGGNNIVYNKKQMIDIYTNGISRTIVMDDVNDIRLATPISTNSSVGQPLYKTDSSRIENVADGSLEIGTIDGYSFYDNTTMRNPSTFHVLEETELVNVGYSNVSRPRVTPEDQSLSGYTSGVDIDLIATNKNSNYENNEGIEVVLGASKK